MVDVTLDMDADPMPLVMLQAETWELHVWAPLADLSRLSEIRSATWDDRRSLQVGTCGDLPVFWTLAEDGQATVLIGQDDETWNLALMVPLTAVDEIVALAR
ncbi:hypothetical protein [Actinomadura fibrosa]|uniref:Uncharacterized protein n=1 Tax=Actinomadura fibrosa TaxID=111802 RepID=A0ABW2XDV2_9ACTN|nr:hypothetical protein [Actinomadura fibrosa]